MAEKKLNTRIQLKNADLASWNTSSLVLKAGEVALAKIDTTHHDAATGNYYKVPTYLMKVGDGEKTFAQLNWLAAPASDVHTWAKKAQMDYADLPQTLRTEIDNLQAAVGNEGSVATKIDAEIKAAIGALDVTDTAVANQFVTAVVQTDGKIAVTRRELTAEDIPALAIAKITGLQDALNAKAALADFTALKDVVGDDTKGLVKSLATETAERTAADEALDAKIETINDETIPGLETRIEANKTAAATAQTAANKAQSEVDALDGVVSTLTQTVANNKTAAETAVANEKTAREAADGALEDAIEALRTAIGNVSNVMNFRGAVAAKTEITDAVEGDVIVVTSGDDNGKEFVYSDGAWVEFGSVDAQQTAIDGLLTRMGTAETKIKNLEDTRATTSALSAAQSALEDAIDLKADKTTVNGIDTRVGNLETVVGNKDNTGLVADVASLKTTVGSATSGLVKDVAALQTASATHATKTELTAAQSALETSISDEVTRATNAENALRTRINEANTAHTTLAGRVTTAEGEIEDLLDAVNTIDTEIIPTLAKNTDLTALTTRVATIEGDYLRAADTFILDCGGPA